MDDKTPLELVAKIMDHGAQSEIGLAADKVLARKIAVRKSRIAGAATS